MSFLQCMQCNPLAPEIRWHYTGCDSPIHLDRQFVTFTAVPHVIVVVRLLLIDAVDDDLRTETNGPT